MVGPLTKIKLVYSSCILAQQAIYVVYFVSIIYKWWQALTTQSNSEPSEVPEPLKRVESDDSFALIPQSGMMCVKNNADGNFKSQLTVFDDQNPAYECHVISNEDPSRGASDTTDADLGSFFARPVQIHSVEWTPGQGLDEFIKPWGLWAKNPRVANRLTNFRNFRGNLCVKILLNGNQFFWGKALLSYMPLPLMTHRTFETGVLDTVQASQRPHLWIDAASSEGGVMKLPFYWPFDAIDITESNNLYSFDNVGTLWTTTIARLAHVSAADPITITYFAWCEDVVLSAPTQTDFGSLSPQAGELPVGGGPPGAEYGTGAISKPASIVKSVADALSSVPVIKPFALATSITASAVGSLATMFGYSRPHVLEGIRRRKIWNTGNTANCDAEDTCDSLALTSKQEVSVDPRIVGLGDCDELTIKHLAEKESWFTIVSWLKSDDQHDPLISIPVTPQLWRYGARSLPPSEDGWGHTPMSYCALPFHYWKGNLTFRFQVVASGYHKGRLLFVWDPVTSHAVPEMNTVYSRVVDIAEQRDFSITIGWGSEKPMLRTREPVAAETYAERALFSGSTSFHNGVLTCYVLNQLVSSSDNAHEVYLNVITSCENLELANPHDRIKKYTVAPIDKTTNPSDPSDLFAQVGVLSDANTSGEVNAPEGAESLHDVGNTAPIDYLAHVCMGERIASFRQLLKRYCYSDSVYAHGAIVDNSVFRFIHTRAIEPMIRGYTSKGVHTDPSNQKKVDANACTMINFVSTMFHSWRGSIRYKFVPTVGINHRPSRVYLSRGNKAYSYEDTEVYKLDADNLTFMGTNDQPGWTGSLISTPEASNVLEAQFPFYSDRRFNFVRVSDFTGAQDLGLQLTALVNAEKGTDVEVGYDVWIAGGEDYNLFFFIGIPTLWVLEIDPVKAS